jgi:diguanylate cyclase (GGDEF)-like protein
VAEGDRIPPEVLSRLLPYLTESILVVDVEGNVQHNLAPPGGLFGHGEREGGSIFAYYHPDDLAAGMELGVSALGTEPGWTGAGIMRNRVADGSYKRFEVTVVNHTDDPAINGFIVRTRSIEGFDTSEYNVPDHEELLSSLAEAIPVAIVVLDPFGNPLYMNSAAESLLHVDLAGLRACGMTGLESAIAERRETPGRSSTEIVHEGRTLAVHLVSRGRPGRVASTVITLEDVTVLARRATLDELTGLPNRAAVLDALAARLLTDPTRVTVVYCDLDGFKLVNDRFGHAVGDRVLSHIGGVLRAAVRDGDVVGRIGGDEFVFVCDDLDDNGLDSLSARIHDGLRTASSPDAPEVTVSLGVARGRPGVTPRDVLHRADVSMYAAKRATETAS